MKLLINTFFYFILTVSISFAQQNNEQMELLICGTEEEAVTEVIPANGDFYELVIPVGFSDRLDNDGTLHWPTLKNSTTYPKHGVFPDGTLLKDYISNNGNEIPIEDWYEPMLDSFFDTHSKRNSTPSLHTVDFEFVKKADGTPYTPDHNMAYLISKYDTDSNIIFFHYEEILTEVVDNIYADNPTLINNADALHFVFKVGSTAMREFHVDYVVL